MNDCLESTLTWCNTYKTKLQGLDSQLEFYLRIMEFIQYIKADKNLQACEYAKANFQKIVQRNDN